MEQQTINELNAFFDRHPKLVSQRENITTAIETLCSAFRSGGKLLVGGNGGSCADADHIVGELMKAFKLKRPLDEDYKKRAEQEFGDKGVLLYENLEQGLPAVSLHSQSGLLTAFINDRNSDFMYAQVVNSLGAKGDVLLAISTSGNAKNLEYAVYAAKLKGIKTILLSGKTGGAIKPRVDVCILSPENETYIIQEDHLPIYHLICLCIETEFFA